MKERDCATRNLISRADAIEAVHEYFGERLAESDGEWNDELQEYVFSKEDKRLLEYNKGINTALKALPSAELPNGDLISRADAMNKCKNAENELTDEAERKGLRVARFILGELPSAEAYKAWTGEEIGRPHGRLIDADKLCEVLNEKKIPVDSRVNYEIVNAPTVSADRPHGEWIRIEKDDGHCKFFWYECNQCGEKPPHIRFMNQRLSNFCPNCGADMRGGDK